MLEFPYAYIYFLLPLGLMIGAVEILSPAPAGAWRMPRMAHAALVIAAAALGLTVAIEYVRLDRDMREMRLSYMGLEPLKSPDEAPSVIVLDHLRAFLVLARTPASADLTAEQLVSLKDTVDRFPHPPLLIRYAVIAARHGDTAGAKDAMDRLCRLHSTPACAGAFREWNGFAAKYPELLAINFD